MPRAPAAARLGGPVCPPTPPAVPVLEVSTVGFLSADAAGCLVLLAAIPLTPLLHIEKSAALHYAVP